MKEKIALAADHRGFEYKMKLADFLKKKNFEVADCGAYSTESCDYPDFILPAAEKIKKGECPRAIGICHSGIGSAIAANKVCGVRAALASSEEQAALSRAHNDSNMLILSSGFLDEKKLFSLVDTWLTTPFEGGRHGRRLDKIKAYEQEHCR